MASRRIAVCLSGLPRKTAQAFPWILKHILIPHDPDVFAFLWADDAPRREDGEPNSHEFKPHIDFIRANYSPLILEAPQQPDLISEFFKKYKTPKEHRRQLTTRKRNALFMYKAIYEANKLKIRHEADNEFKYDVVIRLRPDLGFYDRLALEDTTEDRVYIPSKGRYRYCGGHNDMSAYGNSKSMDIYSSVYEHFQELQLPLWGRRDWQGKPLFWNPHIILKNHLENNGIPVTRVTNNVERIYDR